LNMGCCCSRVDDEEPKTIETTISSTNGWLKISGKTYNGDDFFGIRLTGSGVCSNPRLYLRYKYDNLYRGGDHSHRKVYNGNPFCDAIDIAVTVERDDAMYSISGVTLNDGKSFIDIVVMRLSETGDEIVEDLDDVFVKSELKKGYEKYLRLWIHPQR